MSFNAKQERIWKVLGMLAGIGVLVGILAINQRRKQNAAVGENTDSSDGNTAGTAVIKPGDILLFHHARGLNKLITGFTNSPYYHAAIYSGNRGVVEARTSGVQCGNLQGRERDFVVVPMPPEHGKIALQWATTQLNDTYSYVDLGIIILDRFCRFVHFNYTPKGKYSCGEFVAIAFDRAGMRLVPDRDLNNVVPGDIARVHSVANPLILR